MDNFQSMTVGGQPYRTRDYFAVTNPSTGAVVGHAPNATTDDLDKAVAAAQHAFKAWSRTSDEERAAALGQIAAKLNVHADEMSRATDMRNAHHAVDDGHEVGRASCRERV